MDDDTRIFLHQFVNEEKVLGALYKVLVAGAHLWDVEHVRDSCVDLETAEALAADACIAIFEKFQKRKPQDIIDIPVCGDIVEDSASEASETDEEEQSDDENEEEQSDDDGSGGSTSSEPSDGETLGSQDSTTDDEDD